MKIELLSLGFATAGFAVFALATPNASALNSGEISSAQALAESAPFLEKAPRSAHYDRDSARWTVSDGASTAHIDAKTGELVEIEFE